MIWRSAVFRLEIFRLELVEIFSKFLGVIAFHYLVHDLVHIDYVDALTIFRLQIFLCQHNSGCKILSRFGIYEITFRIILEHEKHISENLVTLKELIHCKFHFAKFLKVGLVDFVIFPNVPFVVFSIAKRRLGEFHLIYGLNAAVFGPKVKISTFLLVDY